jgi:hypothetical protein
LLLLPRALEVCTYLGIHHPEESARGRVFQPVAASHLSTSRDATSGLTARKEIVLMTTAIPLSPALSPEEVITQLRTIESQIERVAPLTKEQRQTLKHRIRNQPKAVVEASINVIGVLDNVSQAMGQPLDDVRQLQDETLRWEAAADQTRAFLKVLEGANLVRRERLALIATQAYTIATQLAKDPDKAALVPHLEEVKRLKAVARRRKTAPDAPAPVTPVPIDVKPPITPKA